MQLLPVLVATCWLLLNIDFWFIELLRGSVELWAGLNLRFFCSRFQWNVMCVYVKCAVFYTRVSSEMCCAFMWNVLCFILFSVKCFVRLCEMCCVLYSRFQWNVLCVYVKCAVFYTIFGEMCCVLKFSELNTTRLRF
jgi:hypothetical protein